MSKIAFLDRDGTLIDEPQTDYQIDSLEKLRILDNVIPVLQALQSNDYELVMITNQDGLGTDSFPQTNFDIPQQAMLKQFADSGITFSKIFICPHFNVDHCTCRKPKTGLVEDWLVNKDFDREHSFMYGDRDSDKDFAHNLGIRFISAQTNAAVDLNQFNFLNV